MQRSQFDIDLVVENLLVVGFDRSAWCRMQRSEFDIDLVVENLLVMGSSYVRALSMQCFEVSLVVGCCEILIATYLKYWSNELELSLSYQLMSCKLM
jgi:hypothetical protein